ncbi:hypothetical protein Ctob_015322 [Chrysochromulina tobinii]|uniref:K Homology domain-containing protein n=1 Tax=Chrysochromulina tobinii TaxID=1460289 RepID=A0A0M0KED2_9EUKA|nr:hypothetical protein Ctob_015322 [Chrysochromulina tobinii]|eukprot:KOO36778.1 hypothetical protein Ctob_015322 [Chrysochromulina sp. CCMP291]
MQLCSGSQIFIIDKYPPPDEGDDHRLLVIIGKPDQVRLAKEKCEQVLARAKEELPPLPPPLTSGWRPVPTVGDAGEEGGQGWFKESEAPPRSYDPSLYYDDRYDEPRQYEREPPPAPYGARERGGGGERERERDDYRDRQDDRRRGYDERPRYDR